MTPKQRGRRIAQIRKAKGWSRYRLAQEAGLSRQHITNIETGAVDLSVGILVRLAKVLDVPVSKLVE